MVVRLLHLGEINMRMIPMSIEGTGFTLADTTIAQTKSAAESISAAEARLCLLVGYDPLPITLTSC